MKNNLYGSGRNLKLLGLFTGVNSLFGSICRIKQKNDGLVSVTLKILIFNKNFNFPVEIKCYSLNTERFLKYMLH